MTDHQPPGLRARIRDALRLAAFRAVPEERLAASWTEILAAALLTLAIPTMYGAWDYGDGGMWNARDIPGPLFLVSVLLGGSIVLARVVRRDEAAPRILMAALLATLAIDAITYAAWIAVNLAMAPELPPAVNLLFYYGPAAWVALAVAAFAWPLRPVAPRRALVALVAVTLLAAPLVLVNPERSLWVKDWSRDGGGDRGTRWAAADEEVVYGQPALLAAALDAVKPERPGVVDVFFVGMAGYGSQDVFMREVDAVADIMRDRFDASGHIVKLVNNPRTVKSAPLASVTALRASLARVAERMDVEEDVLVLFLTSHGSRDHHFSLWLPPLRLHDLDPAMLRDALDQSGIRNRVVIVSACYAGGFVERLRDERTLVIAAAAPDRNSFGCGNEEEWTYFGRAFFDESLRRTHSFVEAFDRAVPVIESRERARNFDPSRPMLDAGAAIRGKLAQLEKQLASPGS